VVPDHLRELGAAVLGHRVALRPEQELRGLTGEAIVAELLAATPLPGAGRRP